MEHPFFSLTKKRHTNIVHYVHGKVEVEVRPDVEFGMPTIWDKDILIYCCSQLVEGIKQGREPKRDRVRRVRLFGVNQPQHWTARLPAYHRCAQEALERAHIYQH